MEGVSGIRGIAIKFAQYVGIKKKVDVKVDVQKTKIDEGTKILGQERHEPSRLERSKLEPLTENEAQALHHEQKILTNRKNALNELSKGNIKNFTKDIDSIIALNTKIKEIKSTRNPIKIIRYRKLKQQIKKLEKLGKLPDLPTNKELRELKKNAEKLSKGLTQILESDEKNSKNISQNALKLMNQFVKDSSPILIKGSNAYMSYGNLCYSAPEQKGMLDNITKAVKDSQKSTFDYFTGPIFQFSPRLDLHATTLTTVGKDEKENPIKDPDLELLQTELKQQIKSIQNSLIPSAI